VKSGLQALERLYSISYDELDGDEEIVFDGVAAHYWGIMAKQGRMLLTKRRIVYLPMRFKAWPKWLSPWSRRDIVLSEIANVSAGPLWRRVLGPLPGFPTFVVELKNGRRYSFQVWSAKTWMQQITTQAALGSQTKPA